jgi:hypothetical protein
MLTAMLDARVDFSVLGACACWQQFLIKALSPRHGCLPDVFVIYICDVENSRYHLSEQAD